MRKRRFAVYAGLNVLFWLTIGILCAAGNAPDPRVIHLGLLFALCSSFVIDIDGLNGRYALLSIFLIFYFVFFGVQDLTDLASGRGGALQGPLSTTEAVIIIGGLMLVIGYRTALAIVGTARTSKRPRDWPLGTLLSVGLAMWLVGTYAMYSWYVNVVKNTTLESINLGIAGLSQLTAMGYVFAQMLQPLGVLLVTYAWRLNRNLILLSLVLAMVLLQVMLGFVIDIKGVALGGGFLVIVATTLIDGKIPKVGIAAAALFVYVAFPVFQAYRTEVSGNGITRASVIENLSNILDRTLKATDRVNSGSGRAQTFFERLSLKASVQMIVEGTAAGIPFQHGYTMTPLLVAFIPRIIWPDKPDIATGRIVNRVFHVSEQEETYISPSHLGELYWNFGWTGVIVGMTLIGMMFGVIGNFNMAEARSVTRVLILVVTIQLAVRGFEGSLTNYVVWLRSMASVGIMHLLFARARGPMASADAGRPPIPYRANSAVGGFPNLLQ